MKQTVPRPVTSPSQLAPGVPERSREVTIKALERDSAARFSTGREMAHALAEAARGAMFDELEVGAWVREQFPEQLDRTSGWWSRSPTAEDVAARALATRLGGDADALPVTDPGAFEAHAATREADVTRGATVLVVDDSALSRRLVSLRLESEGFQVVTCNSAEEALALLSRDAARPGHLRRANGAGSTAFSSASRFASATRCSCCRSSSSPPPARRRSARGAWRSAATTSFASRSSRPTW